MAEDAERRERIPPGRHDLPRDFVAAHQRRRLLDAMAQLCAERGYARASVSEVVKRARVSRNTFYASFDGKEDCFLAAFDAGVAEALAAARTATEGHGTWPEQVHAGMAALLDYIARHPHYARLCLAEAPGLGSTGAERYEGLMQAFVRLLRRGRSASDRGDELPASLEEALVGGVIWIIHQRIVREEEELVQELLPELVEFVLTPYVGRERARGVSEAADVDHPPQGT